VSRADVDLFDVAHPHDPAEERALHDELARASDVDLLQGGGHPSRDGAVPAAQELSLGSRARDPTYSLPNLADAKRSGLGPRADRRGILAPIHGR